MAVRWRFNMAGFAELRNQPVLVSAMESSANRAAADTPFDVRVEVWPHQGRRTGPRTSVQIWANSHQARQRVNANPGELLATLNRARP